MLEFSTIIRQSQSFPPACKINIASICAYFQKRPFHIQIRLFADEIEPYVEINAQDLFVTAYTGHGGGEYRTTKVNGGAVLYA